MGYRSYGAIYLSERALALLEDFLYDRNWLGFPHERTGYENPDMVPLKNTLQEWGLTNYEAFIFRGEENGRIYEFQYLKWYESYPDVQGWERFFTLLESQKIAYDFVRIGENYEDVEIRTHLMFQVSREWECDFQDWNDNNFIFDVEEEE